MLIGHDYSDNQDIHIPPTDTIVLLGRNDNILRQLVLETDECLFIDTRGVDVISYTPRINNTVYFKANDREWPIAFNPLCSGNSDTSLEILNTFRTIYGTSWGPQLEMILTASLRAVMDNPNPTFLKMYQMLTTSWRKTLKNDDPFIAQFWSQFDTWEDKEQFLRTQSTLNKLFGFLHHPVTRNILSQDNKLSFTNKTVHADLSGIPQDLQRLLGSLLLPYSKRVVVTDASLFALPARSSMALEYQRFPKRDFDSLVVFRARGLDREAVAKELGILPHDLGRIAQDSAWFVRSQSLYMKVPELPERYGYGEKIIEQSRRRYATPVEKVEEKVASFLSNSSVRPRVSMGGPKKQRKR